MTVFDQSKKKQQTKSLFKLKVKINGQSDEMLRAAAEQFGSKAEDEIAHGKQNSIL